MQGTAAAVDPLALRRALGAFATGVTVVTVGGARPHGMTANSFTSVSLDPPCILVCVQRTATMHGCLYDAGAFAVSVLGANQEPVARYFASKSRPMGNAQFDTVGWYPGAHTGAPLIVGALAHFECELRGTYDGGDHTIFLGRLLHLRHGPVRPALLFVNGQFGSTSLGSELLP
nr:flavin reductase family protein [Allorhizocola rhizosphaerae]